MPKTTRVLAGFTFEGQPYQPNQVVTFPDAVAKAYADSLDASREAVDAAKALTGQAEPIRHEPTTAFLAAIEDATEAVATEAVATEAAAADGDDTQPAAGA